MSVAYQKIGQHSYELNGIGGSGWLARPCRHCLNGELFARRVGYDGVAFGLGNDDSIVSYAGWSWLRRR